METTEATPAAQVAEILGTAGIVMTAAHVPSTYDPKSKEWQGIAWRVTFQSPRGEFSTDFKQGIGHLPPPLTAMHRAMTLETLTAIRKALATGKVGGVALAPPAISDVVSCLVSDASAADYATYEQWAPELGYDIDSRKGEATYRACLDIARELNRIFGAVVVESLREPCQQM